jgi:hypothetical protein
MRSELAGWAEYGRRASHSRFFWGFRLHLVRALSGLPVLYAPTSAKTSEQATLLAMREGTGRRPGQVVIADKNYFGKDFEELLASEGIVLLRKARKGEDPRPGGQFFKPLRQIIESINATLKTHPDIERLRAKNHQRPRHTRRRPTPRPDRRHLAQRASQRPRPPLPHRLRPLTTPGINRLGR